MERREDSDDVACLKKARRGPMHYRPLEDVLADLAKKQGIYRVIVERSADQSLR